MTTWQMKLAGALLLGLAVVGCKEQKNNTTTATTAEQTASPKSEQVTPTATKTRKERLDRFAHYDNIMSQDSLKQNKTAPVDYYLLALSYSPAFCESQKRNNQGKVAQKFAYQCASDHHFHWVIHGLWPQNGKARNLRDHPRYCQGDLPMLAYETLAPYLAHSPGLALLQGEWEKHGACAFEQPEHYFAKQQQLYQALTLPTEPMSQKALFSWMRKHNPALANLYLGGKNNELYICYNKQWQPINCPK